MKKLMALLLLLAFTTQTFSQGFALLHFYINQNYIAANQCENRYRPMLHCNGKCILAKKMKQQEKKEQQNPERKLQNKSEVSSSLSFFVTALVTPFSAYPAYPALANITTIDWPSSIFRPPC
ncbi:MAG: hypothetical protein IPQ06_06715 [Chitinophagaceae bacterium]|nr:hypothetical protein [Chitinophagaceae bacterium]MBL0272762.1 hypothetical protein [Chitinophagaceae bacterium]